MIGSSAVCLYSFLDHQHHHQHPSSASSAFITHHHSSLLIITHHHSSSLIITHHHSVSLLITPHHSSSLITTHHRSSVSNSSKAILCGCCGCGCCAPELRLGVRYQGNRASRCESHDQDHQFEHHLQGYPITLIGQLVRLSALELKAETKKYKIFKISQDFFQNAKSAEDFLFGR